MVRCPGCDGLGEPIDPSFGKECSVCSGNGSIFLEHASRATGFGKCDSCLELRPMWTLDYEQAKKTWRCLRCLMMLSGYEPVPSPTSGFSALEDRHSEAVGALHRLSVDLDACIR